MSHTQAASACSGIYAHNIKSTHASVPANGGRVAGYLCRIGTTGCAWPAPIIITRDGEEVPGEMIHHGEDYIFIPESPLEVGATYDVSDFGSIVATDPEPVDLTTIEVSVDLEMISSSSPAEDVCCTEAYDSCGGHPCWRSESVELTYTGVGLRVTPSEIFEVYEVVRTEMRLSWTTSTGDTEVTDWATDKHMLASFDEEASEYCVTPEFRSLISGETRTLEPLCVLHGDHPAPGDTTVLPPVASPETLRICPVPVEGFLDEWCEGVSALCEGGSDTSCSRETEYCPAPTDGDPPVGEDPEVGSPDNDGGSAGAGSISPSGEPSNKKSGRGGCSVGAHGRASPRAWGFLSILALGLWFRRSCRASASDGPGGPMG